MFELTQEEAKRCGVIKNLSDGNTIRLIPKDVLDRFQREARIEREIKLKVMFPGITPYAPNNQTPNN